MICYICKLSFTYNIHWDKFPYTFDMLDIEDLMLQDPLHFYGIPTRLASKLMPQTRPLIGRPRLYLIGKDHPTNK